MKKLLLIALLFALSVPAEDSPLVKAAKTTPKKKSTKKVITNADVKKSGGTLTQLPPSKTAAAATSTAPAEPVKGSLTKQDEQRRATEAAAKRVATSESKVKGLEAELARIEQSYYEAMDPNYRDTTIKKRFDQTKQQLDDARKELADARDAQKRLAPKT